MERIAIIPIRSGSKGLQDKNIRLLNGKPLVAYTIECAIKSQAFNKIFVSTDSVEYAEIAEKYGADASFLRSEKNASDTAGSWDVVREVISKFEDQGLFYNEIMLLQATSPLRSNDDILKSIDLLHDKNGNAVQSVTEMEHTPLWANILPDDGCMDEFEKDEYDMPRQFLPKYYRLNGAIYLIKRSELNAERMFHNNCYAYIMPQDRSIDIDSEMDFKIAEIYLKGQQNNV